MCYACDFPCCMVLRIATCWLAGTTISVQTHKDLYLSDADLLAVQVTNETLVTIFQTILSWHLETGGFPDSCRKLGPGIIAATLDMYSQSMAKLLPTPTKSHYTFNLRDFARVIQVLQRPPALCFVVIISCLSLSRTYLVLPACATCR